MPKTNHNQLESAPNGQERFELKSAKHSAQVAAGVDRSALAVLVALFLTFFLHSCRSTMAPSMLDRGGTATDAELADGRVFDDRDAVRAQDAHLIKVEVTVKAPVKKLLPDDTRGLPHQKFLIELSNGTTVLIAHDTAIAPHVPLQPGDKPIIRGEYIWNEKGGLIHFTHHPARAGHVGGFIYFDGSKYQ